MAYIPPQKRHSMALERPFVTPAEGLLPQFKTYADLQHLMSSRRPSPIPELFSPRFNKYLNVRPYKPKVDRSGLIMYGDNAITVWCAVGLDRNNQFPSSLHLEPVSVEPIERKTGEKPLVLVNTQLGKENDERRGNALKRPWEFLAETVWPDLLSSFKFVRNEMKCQKYEEVKPMLVARFGKILYNGSNSMNLENIRGDRVSEATLKQLKRLFHTNVPNTYMENIMNVVVPKIGVDFEEEKDIYHLKLSDIRRPDSTISCKCIINEDKMLEMYKVELNQVRHLVVDVSCLEKDLDLRLMLSTKRILTALSDEEVHSIRNLINSAVLDPEVKGGLRWPMGLGYYGNRYRVIGVWHTKVKSYKSPSLRLKVRYADRSDFKSGTGEATMEITLQLKRLVSEMQEDKLEYGSIYDMFQDTIRLIWDNFLCCDQFLT
ncbi:uncharacterized protein LOC123201709 [Mangifera indica]|uniref:uncharacterized protein LOC123201709 n=1 Tax=Mangifera indica TaxID=29780 RepID=UPI001CFA3B0B|nr:uncharacterized protein LOC123201709 [Mangifera indica]XP_044473216.1 uncharacterized protein LOC123201709 [Mangifera indica]